MGKEGVLAHHTCCHSTLPPPLPPFFPPRFGMAESEKTRRSILVGWMNRFLIGKGRREGDREEGSEEKEEGLVFAFSYFPTNVL